MPHLFNRTLDIVGCDDAMFILLDIKRGFARNTMLLSYFCWISGNDRLCPLDTLYLLVYMIALARHKRDEMSLLAGYEPR